MVKCPHWNKHPDKRKKKEGALIGGRLGWPAAGGQIEGALTRQRRSANQTLHHSCPAWHCATLRGGDRNKGKRVKMREQKEQEWEKHYAIVGHCVTGGKALEKEQQLIFPSIWTLAGQTEGHSSNKREHDRDEREKTTDSFKSGQLVSESGVNMFTQIQNGLLGQWQ